MKEFWNTIQLIFAAIGGWLGYFLGGCDGLLYALIAFVVIGLSWYLPQGADFYAGWHRKCSGHLCAEQRKRFADGGYFLLHLQRGCIPSGECRASGPPDTGENQGGFGAAP